MIDKYQEQDGAWSELYSPRTMLICITLCKYDSLNCRQHWYQGCTGRSGLIFKGIFGFFKLSILLRNCQFFFSFPEEFCFRFILDPELPESEMLFSGSGSCEKQCSGSMTFWGGSGSGSADPCLWLMDPDPAIVIDLQDATKKLVFNTNFSAYYFLKVHLHHFSKIKSQKESQK